MTRSATNRIAFTVQTPKKQPVYGFCPQGMLASSELAAVGRLLRRRSDLRIDCGATPGTIQDDRRRMTRDAISTRIEQIAARAWQRNTDLAIYSVVHIDRLGVEARLQVLRISLDDDWRRGTRDLWWSFEGRRLRNDGTLGDRHEELSFRVAAITRRHLDGQWRPVLQVRQETA
ncbi:hypothetical protein IMW82_13550 [Rhodanobacter sp. B2A1Ga4]|uniref:hypothetical protein n=1 Tax=Rhodanobacter sp. B2A1Ga4 TaxID=2778647 RepID=UPI001B359B03|nr:hypothetical protein [Rhodanobacter sp. B2A1Ga4]MBQ4855697.1 hypothetical protein [Rhodanobacter sp. B2A1Ga4]